MRIIILGLIVFLTGCQVTPTDVSENLQVVVDNAIESKTPTILNQSTPYYSYYLPPHMGVRFSNKIATVFTANLHEIVMSVDVPSIIMQRYYRDYLQNNMRVLDVSNSFFSYNGSFKNANNETQNIDIKIDRIDDRYVILLHSSQFVLTSTTDHTSISSLLYDMIILLRSALADRDQIISVYSNKQEITYERQMIDIFEQIAPETGTLVDMDRLIKGEIDFSELINPEIEPEQEIEDIEANTENDEDTSSDGE
jgi:hypothetical protein